MPRVTRRSLLGSATSLVGCCACGPEFIQNTAAVAQTVPGSAQYGVKALFFDVFGTLVDWREKAQRQRRWFSLAAAADKLDDRELSEFVRTLDAASECLEPPTGATGKKSALDEILMLRR